MEAVIEYIVRLSWIWMALLAFYFLSLHKNDNWILKRRFLTGAYWLGLLIPLLPAFQQKEYIKEWASPFIIVDASTTVMPLAPVANSLKEASGWTVSDMIIPIYLIITLFLSLRLFYNYRQVWQWKKEGQNTQFRNHPTVIHPKIKVPFTGLGTIFLPDNLSLEAQQMACLHEHLHLQKRHHWERIPMMLGKILLWFHPLQWVFQYKLEAIQEYEVDEGVLQVFPLSQYGKLLIQASMAPMAWQLNLFSSPLKNRIDMMRKVKQKRAWRWAHSVSLSLLLAFLLINCSDAVEDINLLPEQETQAPQSERPFYQSDLWREIGTNLKYPKETREAGITGMYIVYFNALPNGELIDFEVSSKARLDYKEDNEIIIVGYSVEGSAPEKRIRDSQWVITDFGDKREKKPIQATDLAAYEALKQEIKRTITIAVKNVNQKEGLDYKIEGENEIYMQFRLQ